MAYRKVRQRRNQITKSQVRYNDKIILIKMLIIMAP